MHAVLECAYCQVTVALVNNDTFYKVELHLNIVCQRFYFNNFLKRLRVTCNTHLLNQAHGWHHHQFRLFLVRKLH